MFRSFCSRRLPLAILILGTLLVVLSSSCGAKAQDRPTSGSTSRYIDAVPSGYALHAYDDCGIPERQPHVLMQDSYCWTFGTSDTDADIKARSAVFSYKTLNMQYDGLDPTLSYVLAVTYASDHVYKRKQSLWANGAQLHPPLVLPKAQAIRRIVSVPRKVTQSGKMQLQFRIHGEVNATVSIVELWANAPSPHKTLRLFGIGGMVGDLAGQVLDLAYEPVSNAVMQLHVAGEEQPLSHRFDEH